MTVFDVWEKVGVWFDMDDGGRVQLHSPTMEDLTAIRKQTVMKKVEYKKIEGKAERFEYDETNEELQNELFWDTIIINWENIFDKTGTALPCTKANKVLLMSRTARFAKFVGEAMKTLQEDELHRTEASEKN